MNKFLFVFFSLLFMNCSGNSPEEPIVITDGYDEDGVFFWLEEDYVFNNYISSIGNLNYMSVYPRVNVRHSDGQIISVSWKINDESHENREAYKRWDVEQQKWLVSYTAVIDEGYKFNFGDKIEATISIDNKQIKRTAIIKENRILGDVYALKWGMTQTEVFNNESTRIKGGITLNAISPEIMIADVSYNMNSLRSATVYTFENGKLVEVGEYEQLFFKDEIVSVPEDFVKFCKQLGYMDNIELTDEKLKETYTWNNTKVHFTIHQRSDMYLDYIGVSYRK